MTRRTVATPAADDAPPHDVRVDAIATAILELAVEGDRLLFVERHVLRAAMARAKGREARAARLLGVTRSVLERRLAQLGLAGTGMRESGPLPKRHAGLAARIVDYLDRHRSALLSPSVLAQQVGGKERAVAACLRALETRGRVRQLGGYRYQSIRGSLVHALSGREREVFVGAAHGESNAQMARRMGISLKTIQTHRAKVNAKLKVHTPGALVHFAATHGFLRSHDEKAMEPAPPPPAPVRVPKPPRVLKPPKPPKEPRVRVALKPAPRARVALKPAPPRVPKPPKVRAPILSNGQRARLGPELRLRHAETAFRESLEERERLVFDARLAVGAPTATLEKIGARCGVTRERVRQLEMGIAQKLWAYLQPATSQGEGGEEREG